MGVGASLALGGIETAGVCFLPDFGAWLDDMTKMLDRAEALLFLLLIIVIVFVGGLIVANLIGRRGRG